MSHSTPTAVTRYRPAVLVLTGAAAAYGVYIIYNSLQAAPSDRLHRSNAVRRSNHQRRPSRTTRIISRLESEAQPLGEYSILGLVVPLDPLNLIAPDELRELLATTVPDARRDVIEVETARLYDVFLDRLLDSRFPTRPLAVPEIEAVSRWIGDRLPNAAAIPRAIERRAQRLNDARLLDTDGAESVAGTDVSWNSDDDSDGEGLDPDGQTLQRTLYHIAEDRARQEGVVHRGITCNSCDEKPIRGTRWHCANCVDFDLCSTCEATNSHTKTHVFYKIRVPAPYLSLAKQEPLYPGKPHMMHHSVNPALKRRLASESKMEFEEIEALWDQFTCLASSEWSSDPNKIGWALDRRVFNHAFVPRYSGFVAAPNLIYDRIFQYYDSDNNGLIGFEEWIKGIDGMHTSDVRVKARIVFNGYDIDGDGYISRQDILRIFRAYYAIEKEATRNFVAELTEELSVRNSMDTVRSGQPLGSAFPPSSLPTPNAPHPSFTQKQNGTFDENSPVILDSDFEKATRKSIIEANELHQLEFDELSKRDAGERLVQRAWSRREFTLDEEEGLTRPNGADITDDEEETRDDQGEISVSETQTASTVTRRSSKVHFQDEVPTKQAASKRWGGYEIPEPEQDLGQEVLYQITQQAFNELLDPLFLARENMALDARSLRKERRKHAEAIDALLTKQRGWGKYNAAIFRFGVFRFVKGVVDTLCQQMSLGVLEAMRQYTFKDDPKWYGSMVSATIEHAEKLVLNDLKIRKDDPPLSGIAEWNAELIKARLDLELKSVIVRLLNVTERGGQGTKNTAAEPAATDLTIDRDPTMPQFRPNSTVESQTSADEEVLASMQQSSDISVFGQDLEDFTDEDGRLRIGPDGPFFVTAHYSADEAPSPEKEQPTAPTATSLMEVEFRNDEGRAILHISNPQTSSQTNPRPSRASSQEGEDSETSSSSMPPFLASSSQDVRAPKMTDVPWVQNLYLNTSTDGKQTLSYTRCHVAHTQSLYAIAPEPDQTAALIANLRCGIKGDPEHALYIPLLASCEAVEQESRERRGDGLLSFDEFEEVLKNGRLRFLESWMDWVSL
jgi:Ca2+-binding EF-hand superfamily protein